MDPGVPGLALELPLLGLNGHVVVVEKSNEVSSSNVVRAGKAQFQCPQCSKSYLSKGACTTHIRTVHEKQSAFSCPICTKTLYSRYYYKRHVMHQHSRNFAFNCEDCGIGFPSKSKLITHCKISHEGFRFVCQYCKKKFSDAYYYSHHLKRHESSYVCPTFKCGLCDKILYSKAQFSRHRLMHKQGSCVYVCDICGKTFTTLEGFKDHQSAHLGTKKFMCETCGKGCSTKKILVIHRRMHTKEKPYLCQICDRRFAQKTSLTIHIRYHTGDRPYVCELCTRRFVSRSLLKSHKCKIENITTSG